MLLGEGGSVPVTENELSHTPLCESMDMVAKDEWGSVSSYNEKKN